MRLQMLSPVMLRTIVLAFAATSLGGCLGLLEFNEQIRDELGAGPLRCRQYYSADRRIADCTEELNQLAKQSGNPAQRQASIARDLVTRGDAYLEKGDREHSFADYDGAVAATDEAIRLNMGDAAFVASTLANRADAHHGKGDYAAAISDLDQAIQHAPMNEYYYRLRGNEFAFNNDYDHAIGDFDRAIGLAGNVLPVQASLHQHRGAAYLAKGDYDRAIADENQVIQAFVSGDFVTELAVRGAAYRGKGNYGQAIMDVSAALKPSESRDAPYLLTERAHSLSAMGKYPEAIQDYDGALRRAPRNAEALYGRGQAKRKSGDEAGGAADIGAAIAIDPNISNDVTKSGVIRTVFR